VWLSRPRLNTLLYDNGLVREKTRTKRKLDDDDNNAASMEERMVKMEERIMELESRIMELEKGNK
jgi:hypothetical protein